MESLSSDARSCSQPRQGPWVFDVQRSEWELPPLLHLHSVCLVPGRLSVQVTSKQPKVCLRHRHYRAGGGCVGAQDIHSCCTKACSSRERGRAGQRAALGKGSNAAYQPVRAPVVARVGGLWRSEADSPAVLSWARVGASVRQTVREPTRAYPSDARRRTPCRTLPDANHVKKSGTCEQLLLTTSWGGG